MPKTWVPKAQAAFRGAAPPPQPPPPRAAGGTAPPAAAAAGVASHRTVTVQDDDQAWRRRMTLPQGEGLQAPFPAPLASVFAKEGPESYVALRDEAKEAGLLLGYRSRATRRRLKREAKLTIVGPEGLVWQFYHRCVRAALAHGCDPGLLPTCNQIRCFSVDADGVVEEEVGAPRPTTTGPVFKDDVDPVSVAMAQEDSDHTDNEEGPEKGSRSGARRAQQQPGTGATGGTAPSEPTRPSETVPEVAEGEVGGTAPPNPPATERAPPFGGAWDNPPFWAVPQVPLPDVSTTRSAS